MSPFKDLLAASSPNFGLTMVDCDRADLDVELDGEGVELLRDCDREAFTVD